MMLDDLMADLRRDEGNVLWAYQDSLGYWTIGNGFLIDKAKGGGLFQNEIDFILKNRIQIALQDIQNEPWYLAANTDNRRRALLNMRYQLGAAGIRTFKNSLAMIQAQRWTDAATNLRKSIWATQTPLRAERVISMIENG